MTDQAQPDEGQGGAGSTGLFDQYLQTVPEDAREVVGQYLADASKQVNSRFEEAAQLRNTYEPFSQVNGLDQYTPQDLQQLVQWHQSVAASPDGYKEWLKEAAQEAGLTLQEQQQVEQELEDLTPERVRSLAEEIAQQRLEPFEAQVQEIRAQQFVNAESQLVNERFAALESENGIQLTNEQREIVVALGLDAMPDDGDTLVAGKDWVGAGFDRFKAIYAQAQTAFVSEKTSQPAPALSAGGTSTYELPRVDKDGKPAWSEAGQRALERLRNART